MRLSTYPRLNLPTKRFGVESGDWIWVASSIFPGLLFKSFILFAASFIAVYVFASKIKPARPRGWLSAWAEYALSPHQFIAELEPHE